MITWCRRNAAQTDQRPRIAVLTCLWRRPELTDVVLAHNARLAAAVTDVVDLTVVAVGSEGRATRDLAARHGAAYVEHGNEPLGAKWNAGLRAVEARRPDAVLVVGSDDLVCEQLVRHYAALIRAGARYVALLDGWFLDLTTRRAAYWPGYGWSRPREPVGMARCVHRDWLDELGWELWAPELNRGLDASMTRRLAPLMAREPRGVELLRAARHGLVALDVKSGPTDNLWSFDAITSRLELVPVAPEPLLTALGAPSAEAVWLLCRAEGSSGTAMRL